MLKFSRLLCLSISYFAICAFALFVEQALASAQAIQQEQEKGQEKSQEDDWNDDWGSDEDWGDQSPFKWSFKSSLGVGRLLSQDSNIKDSVLTEWRNSFEFDWQGEYSKIESEFEYLVDDVLEENELNVYQLNYTYSGFDNLDIKIGRQVITWGTGDLLFLNDLFSKSWKSFFNGRNDKYLKPPVEAARFSYYGNSFNWEIAALPNFEPDQTPDGERYSFYFSDVGIAQPINPIWPNVPNEPEISARIFGQSSGLEWAIYLYTGYFKSPSKIDGGLTYAEMNSFGASIRLPALGGLFNSEFAFYDSKEDSSGRNPFINNSQFRFLVGFEKEIATNTTLASQLYVERTLNYDELLENAFLMQRVPDENRTMLTFRLTNLAFQQRLTNSVMLFYSPSDEDHFLRASSTYKYDDNWTLVFGVNLLEGDMDETFLAQMKDNSNWFTRIEYRL